MATKVILTQDVEHLGAAGTVQTVKEGFARNYLLPKKLAEIATPGTIKQVQERQAAADRRIRKQEVRTALARGPDRRDDAQLHCTGRAGGTALRLDHGAGDRGRTLPRGWRRGGPAQDCARRADPHYRAAQSRGPACRSPRPGGHGHRDGRGWRNSGRACGGRAARATGTARGVRSTEY